MDIAINSDQWRSMLVAETEKMGISLSPDQAERLCLHAYEVIAANLKFNLTSITDPVDVMVKHVIDSAVAVRYIEKEDARIIDVGSGGGFPGIPIKIIMPEIDISLVDSSRKKVNFLNYILRKLGLSFAQAVQARAEEMPAAVGSGQGFDIAISRAFTSLRGMVEVVLPLIKPSGMIIAMKGSSVNAEIDELMASSIAVGDHKSMASDLLQLELYHYKLPVLDLLRSVVLVRFKHSRPRAARMQSFDSRTAAKDS